MLGLEVPFKVSSSASSSLTISPLKELNSGIYFVTYSAAGQSRVTKKLIVNK
jgi:hypothetical protein